MFTLIFNTAPVAFGALGVPITVLGVVTGLKDTALAAMVGRQLPFFALALPFYVMAIYGGMRSVRALWPLLLVAGGSFGFVQYLASNHLGYALTDVLSSMGSLIATLLFMQRGARRRTRNSPFAMCPALSRMAKAAAIGAAGCPGSSCP